MLRMYKSVSHIKLMNTFKSMDQIYTYLEIYYKFYKFYVLPTPYCLLPANLT